ncbi:PPC domain-containing protein [Fischerella thermalis]|uniref:PPC domain-containing protein n=1 Tax=Fischerella thermalis TaxID=372787 RepID=UPI000C808ED2|nr:PPC domain-containing protein [Fischerella thermalis]PLZ30127.1 peptidase [Fischerella thermalis WC558]PLZ51672.1 peptidase [Fischerella thermalis WC442]PLZ57857.1 peptidase [Fischerella thermalis WC439]PLZ79548.1 peptidase [Fischerella thermalis WC245]PLZ82904.1 peptidase [Fischerella thermalis WC213]
MFKRKSNKNFWHKFDLALIIFLSSSLLITNYPLPINALEIPKQSREFKIAKTPDEREPEAVKQAIEQIPVTQPSPPAQTNPPVESPIPPTPASSPTPASTPTPQPSDTGSPTPTPTPASTPTPQPTYRPSPGSTQPAPQPNSRPANSSRSRTPKPTNNQGTTNNRTSGGSPVSGSKIPNARPINFVDIQLGVLAPGDFKSQGRYFHFYQFEGRENQLIQIRLVGSADQRHSSNLNLNPFMILLDPNNNVLAKRSSGEAKDAFLFVRLPQRGVYTIAVTSRNPGEIGRYSLALRNDRASYTLDESEQLTANGSNLRKNGSPYNVSSFEGKRDQLVSIRVDSVLEEFSPYIVLLNSKGQVIAADNDKDGRYTALIDRAKLPEDGTYYVVVISSVPQRTGTYRLTVF